MELFLDDYEYSLRFSLTPYSTMESKKKWNELKTNCENGNNESIANEWISLCNSEINKSLSFLNSMDGGIEDDKKKDCRFRYSFATEYEDNDIVIRHFKNSISSKWTYTQLDDLVQAFERMVNNHIGGIYVSGCIVMVKTNKIYYDSDSD